MLCNDDVNVSSLRVSREGLQVNAREKTLPTSAYKRMNLLAFDTRSIKSNIQSSMYNSVQLDFS